MSGVDILDGVKQTSTDTSTAFRSDALKAVLPAGKDLGAIAP
jgi:hypothetical protein